MTADEAALKAFFAEREQELIKVRALIPFYELRTSYGKKQHVSTFSTLDEVAAFARSLPPPRRLPPSPPSKQRRKRPRRDWSG